MPYYQVYYYNKHLYSILHYGTYCKLYNYETVIYFVCECITAKMTIYLAN